GHPGVHTDGIGTWVCDEHLTFEPRDPGDRSLRNSLEVEAALSDALQGRVSDEVYGQMFVQGMGAWHRWASMSGPQWSDIFKPTYRPGWAAQDLLAHGDVPLEPPSVGSGRFLYAGQRHGIASEPGQVKSWLGLFESVAVMKQGGRVVWVNTDNMPAPAILERL